MSVLEYQYQSNVLRRFQQTDKLSMPISCVGTVLVLVQSSRWPVSLLSDAAARTAGLHTFSECGQPTCLQGPGL